jgi:hypothetical protein
MPDADERRVPQRKNTLTHEVTDTDEVVIYDGSGPQLLVLNDVAAGVCLMDAEPETVTRDVLAFLGQLEHRKLITWKEAT